MYYDIVYMFVKVFSDCFIECVDDDGNKVINYIDKDWNLCFLYYMGK